LIWSISRSSTFRLCKGCGVKELTFFGFTKDNTRRPSDRLKAFRNACVFHDVSSTIVPLQNRSAYSKSTKNHNLFKRFKLDI
jgi:undecaprenyl pyrophosphate synthase